MFLPRQLLARLRLVMASGASGAAVLPRIVRLVSTELGGEVCSIYALRPGEILELVATEGLAGEAVGRTRLRVGEGVVGTVLAGGLLLNLPDARLHPAFVFRAETGEQELVAMLALPVRRSGRLLGVLAVQHRTRHHYDDLEVEVLETVAMLVAEVLASLGVVDGAEQSFGAALTRRFSGTVLVPGLAVGPIVTQGAGSGPARLLADDTIYEIQRLNQAAEQMQRGIDALIARSLDPRGEAGEQSPLAASREVLAAYRMVASDTRWLERAREYVRTGLTAEAAVYRSAGELRERMRRIADPYLRERLADIEDLVGRLLTTLGGQQRKEASAGAILVARRLGPADLLDWHAAGIAGLALEEGTATGHAAIIARALGLPMLSGVAGIMEAVCAGDTAVLSADERQLILRPEADMQSAYRRILRARGRSQALWSDLRGRPAATADGTGLTLMLNIGLPLELDQLAATGADGIGLFRTEIPVLASGRLLDRGEQTDIYRQVLDAAGGLPVHFRTLDLGGDKMLPHAPAPAEENPAMGWRSLRVGLDRPSMLRRQLAAMLAAADGRALSVMFPMVATVAEYRAAHGLLTEEVRRAGRKPERLRVGAMLEVPALLWQLPALLPLLDFLSVGTNDLLQFLFAADRSTAALAGRYDLLSPPALDMLEQVRRAAAEARVEVSVCGESASRPLEAMALAALGYDVLSMPATALLPIKASMASLNVMELRGVLLTLRKDAGGAASLRAPLSAWAVEHGVAV